MRAALALFAILSGFAIPAHAEVVLRDNVAAVGAEVTLSAQTRGRFLPRGGEVVQFEVDGNSIGRALSGGDAWAYKQYVAGRAGLLEITARYGSETGRGLLLSLEKGAKIVFIDMEGTLVSNPFYEEKDSEVAATVRKVMEGFPVVYLRTGVINESLLKKWLSTRDFPEAPVIAWAGGSVFQQVVDMGLGIKAAIGGPEVLGTARKHGAELISFEPLEGVRHVKKWKEIEEILNE